VLARTGIPGAEYVAVAALLALVPLVLAVLAFGHAFRASETDRVDTRLGAQLGAAVDAVDAASRTAETTARDVAGSRTTQVALLKGQPVPPPAKLPPWLTVTTAADAPSDPLSITRRVAVASGGRTVGVVTARISLPTLMRAIGARTSSRLALVVGGRAVTGEFRGAAIPFSGDRAADVRIGGRTYHVLGRRIGTAGAIVAAVPKSEVDANVHHRQLMTLAAGVVTIAALAFVALLVLAGRGPLRLGRAIRGHRSPAALVGDVAAAAHDTYALLPVLLETAVVATNAEGGYVVWDDERIATLGTHSGQPIVLPLDDEDATTGTRSIVLHSGRGGFSAEEENVARSLVAQGRIALENARLQSIVRRQAVTDELTDLSNRRRFMEEIQLEVARAERLGTELALVLFDLDHFKQINDQFGHQAGDGVLRRTAGVIRDRVRETDVPARIGGEEFAVILPGTDRHGGRSLAEHLRHDLPQLVAVPEGDWRVTASFGVADHVRGETADALIAAADRALYRAKAEGRDRVCLAQNEEKSPAA
jgi:diguanylate cyclase (GGDEF)-like protein